MSRERAVDKVQIDLPSRSQLLPGNSDEVIGAEQNLPSQVVSGRKRKRPQASATRQAKVPCLSSSQLLRADEQKELELPKDNGELDAILEWVVDREASAGSGEPLSELCHTLPPVQHQLSELCTVDYSAVSVPPPPPSCDLDWHPQSQCTILTLDDLVNGFDRDRELLIPKFKKSVCTRHSSEQRHRCVVSSPQSQISSRFSTGTDQQSSFLTMST